MFGFLRGEMGMKGLIIPGLCEKDAKAESGQPIKVPGY
jgi:hypothetical protein